MQSDNACRGLCVNCKHAPYCTFPRSPDRPITQCDEYECDGPPSATAGAKNPPGAEISEEYL